MVTSFFHRLLLLIRGPRVLPISIGQMTESQAPASGCLQHLLLSRVSPRPTTSIACWFRSVPQIEVS